MNRRIIFIIIAILIAVNVFLVLFYSTRSEKITVSSQIPSLHVELTSKSKLLDYLNKLKLYEPNAVTLFKTNPVRSTEKITVKRLDIQITDKVQQFEQYIDANNKVYQSYDLKYLPESSTLRIIVHIDPSVGDINSINQRISYMIRVVAWDITQSNEFPGAQSNNTLNKKNNFMKNYSKDIYFSSKK